MQYFALHSSRDVAAPVVAASYPVATARKQALLCRALQFRALHYFAVLSIRCLAAPVGPTVARWPCEVTSYAMPCSAMHCNPLPFATVPSHLPNRSYSVDCSPDMGYKICSPCEKTSFALPCTAMLCIAIRSAHAVKLCSHFFRLACFKLCQVVTSKLGAVVAKPFQHGRMNKRILYIRHVQYFGDNRH